MCICVCNLCKRLDSAVTPVFEKIISKLEKAMPPMNGAEVELLFFKDAPAEKSFPLTNPALMPEPYFSFFEMLFFYVYSAILCVVDMFSDFYVALQYIIRGTNRRFGFYILFTVIYPFVTGFFLTARKQKKRMLQCNRFWIRSMSPLPWYKDALIYTWRVRTEKDKDDAREIFYNRLKADILITRLSGLELLLESWPQHLFQVLLVLYTDDLPTKMQIFSIIISAVWAYGEKFRWDVYFLNLLHHLIGVLSFLACFIIWYQAGMFAEHWIPIFLLIELLILPAYYLFKFVWKKMRYLMLTVHESFCSHWKLALCLAPVVSLLAYCAFCVILMTGIGLTSYLVPLIFRKPRRSNFVRCFVFSLGILQVCGTIALHWLAWYYDATRITPFVLDFAIVASFTSLFIYAVNFFLVPEFSGIPWFLKRVLLCQVCRKEDAALDRTDKQEAVKLNLNNAMNDHKNVTSQANELENCNVTSKFLADIKTLADSDNENIPYIDDNTSRVTGV